jgi:Na+-translocating ferredoxin:NAD+ oxidoreductase RnfG subunit
MFMQTVTNSLEFIVGTFLYVKLRTGLPNSILSTLFSLTKSQIQRSIHSAKNAMMSDYVPHHLGFSHIDHETLLSLDDFFDNVARTFCKRVTIALI